MTRMKRGVGLAAAIVACETNPATGKRIFTPLSREEEVALGAQAAPQLSQEFGGPIQSSAVQQYVTQLGQKLAKQTEGDYPSLNWQFTALNSPVVNAFSLPGGKVFITRGLMEKMSNEAQMAGVLGHEIGHVTAQHVAQQVGKQTLMETGLQITGAAVGQAGGAAASYGQLVLPALNVGGQLLMLKFSRSDENQADSLGLRYMTRAGYDPRGQVQVMQILQSLGTSGAEWLQTHPLPETRIEQVQSQINSQYGAMVNNPNYGLYPERFAPVLAELKRLPPAPQPKPAGAAGSGSQMRSSQPARGDVIGRPAR